jgi:hypothetical protein
MVLAVDTTQVTVAEEDIAHAIRTDERGLLSKVWRVRRNNGQISGIAPRNLIPQPVVATIMRTDVACTQHPFQARCAPVQLTRLKEFEIRGTEWHEEITGS